MFNTKSLSVSYAAVSRTGGRERNEDSILTLERDGGYCFAAADGLGGHGFGQEASKLLTEVFAREFGGVAGNRKFLAHAFNRAQEEILALQALEGAINQMKTTAVALSIIGGKCAWGHVGDSRLYYFKRGVLSKRTLDHSVPQVLALSGEISECDIATHPDRSRLLCALGDKWDEPRYELSKEISLRRDTAFLLCTDGVWECLTDRKLAPPAGAGADAWLSAIIDEVLYAGQNSKDIDNYSAIAVTIK